MVAKEPELISKLQHYKDQYNWNEPEFQLAIKKTGKFEENKPDINVNKLFNSKKGIYIVCRSRRNATCSREAKLLT